MAIIVNTSVYFYILIPLILILVCMRIRRQMLIAEEIRQEQERAAQEAINNGQVVVNQVGNELILTFVPGNEANRSPSRSGRDRRSNRNNGRNSSSRSTRIPMQVYPHVPGTNPVVGQGTILPQTGSANVQPSSDELPVYTSQILAPPPPQYQRND